MCMYWPGIHLKFHSKKQNARRKRNVCSLHWYAEVLWLVDRDLLLYRLLSKHITGKFYHSMKALYNMSASTIRINNRYTIQFQTKVGVQTRGGPLPPIVHLVFVGSVRSHNVMVSLLLYVDDIVILAENHENMQCLLDILGSWCHKWCMCINLKKMKIVDFWNVRQEKTAVKFKYQGDEVEVVPMYRYLGYHFDKHMKYNIGCEALASSGSRALGVIISKFKDIKDSGYGTFNKLYSMGVEPILDYFSSIWCNDINTCKAATNVFNRAHHHYTGLPVCTTLAGMYGEMGWMHPRNMQFLNMIHL